MNPRPLVLSLQKLISAHLPHTPSPVVDRRKAVTIGGGRWLKPLTFQVPDAISNFLPASSNIFKVHDEPPKNNKTTDSGKPNQGNPFDGQNGMSPSMMNAYDPLGLITNFDQNGFFKPGAGGAGPSPFAFSPNASSSSPFGGFDESQLASMQNDPLFAMPNTPHFSSSHFQQQLGGDKPFNGMPLYEADPEPSFQSQLEQMQQSQMRPMKHQQQQPLFQQQEFYPQSDETPSFQQRPVQSHNNGGSRYANQASLNEPRYVNQASVNEARYKQAPGPSDDQPSQHQHQQQSMGDELQMAEGAPSYRHKELYKSQPSMASTSLNYQGDYFPQKPHRRLPPTGSGNYDYSADPFGGSHSADSSSFYGSLAESDQESGASAGRGHYADDYGNSKSVSNHRPSMSIGYGGGPASTAAAPSKAPSSFVDGAKESGHHHHHHHHSLGHEGHSTSLRPLFASNSHPHHHHHHLKSQNDHFLSSTERPFFHAHFSNGQSPSIFGNDSKSTGGSGGNGVASELSAASEFFSHHLSPQSKQSSNDEGATSADSSNSANQKMLSGTDNAAHSLLKSGLFEAAAKHLSEHSDVAANSFRNFFDNPTSSMSQFQQAAASMLSPVMVKNDVGGGPQSSLFSGVSGVQSKMPLLSSNGVNVFPSALGQTRPVSNRIKEFFKSMLNQKY